MPGEQLSLSKSSLAYAKLTATPTDSAWSQVYNAGNLFACLSLTLAEPSEDNTALQNLGKELFNNLEAEFFTLEEKTIDTIREAILNSTKHIPSEVTANFCLAYFKDQTLYLFLLGKGRVIMKRGEKMGILLDRTTTDENSQIITASGYLTNGDTIILETSQFAKNISESHIADALQLELPSDIAESLSIHMHEHTDGDQAAIVISYHGITQQTPSPSKETPLEQETEEEDEPLHQAHIPINETTPSEPPLFSKLSDMIKRIQLPFPRHNRRIVMGGLTHRKKFFLSITVLILALLVTSIVFTKQKEEDAKTTALFESIYTPALKSYDEGKALVNLNADLSREDFLEAEKLLLDGRDKFPKDSDETKQIEELLAKVQQELKPPEQANASSSTLNRNMLTVNVLNGSGVAGAAGETADTLRDLGYTVETVGNADTYEYEGITIVITKEKEAYLELLKKDLAGKKIQTEIDDDLAVDAEVIVGK